MILAAAATVLSEHLICVEEPELNLHPALQRKLLRYLRDETDNQYLVATHSAHMLDSAYASISGLKLVEGASRVAPAIEPSEVAAIASDLGMRASDLVQSNAVVWVEGPSDRIYLKTWLADVAPDLIEGVHFSIMFYGGALLRHLAASDPAVDEFISLPRINRNFWVIIDSDKTSSRGRLNATKERVLESLSQYGRTAGAWVTAGYTIENYVPADVMAAAVETVHPDGRYRWAGERYVNPLATERFQRRKSDADKAAIAQSVAESWHGVAGWPYDLRARAVELAESLYRANDLAQTASD